MTPIATPSSKWMTNGAIVSVLFSFNVEFRHSLMIVIIAEHRKVARVNRARYEEETHKSLIKVFIFRGIDSKNKIINSDFFWLIIKKSLLARKPTFSFALFRWGFFYWFDFNAMFMKEKIGFHFILQSRLISCQRQRRARMCRWHKREIKRLLTQLENQISLEADKRRRKSIFEIKVLIAKPFWHFSHPLSSEFYW